MTNSSTLAIDTGMPRNVTGHVVSGALAAGALAGAINYDKFKKEKMTKKEAVQSTIKLSAQGGIATGSAIAAANYMGTGKIFSALTAISLGAMGVYAVEKISDKLGDVDLIDHQETNKIESTGE